MGFNERLRSVGQKAPNRTETPPPMPARARTARFAARIAVALVCIVNVQCAVSFIASPAIYVSAYELSGVAGETAIRGLGVAFLMWNATYPAVIVDPDRFYPLYVIILVQQLIGLIGESWVYVSLPAGHALLQASIGRFIAFDGCGLVVMGVAFAWLTLCRHRAKEERNE